MFVCPNLKHLSKYFAQIYRAQYGAAMLLSVPPRDTNIAAGK